MLSLYYGWIFCKTIHIKGYDTQNQTKIRSVSQFTRGRILHHP